MRFSDLLDAARRNPLDVTILSMMMMNNVAAGGQKMLIRGALALESVVARQCPLAVGQREQQIHVENLCDGPRAADGCGALVGAKNDGHHLRDPGGHIGGC